MIEFVNASKTYGGVVALADFSAVVPSGTITVLMGLSGSGKTTAVRMVNKMVIPSTGSVLIDGVDVSSQNAVALRRSIGYVMQDIGLLPHKTVLDNVVLIATIAGQSRETAQQNAREMLTLVGIDPSSFGRFPRQLSGGQQQRVGVARALATKPNILLMDEPFGAVDPIVREELQDELLRIQRELKLTVLFVTHDRGEALKIADQLIVLSQQGTIEQAGTPRELTKKPANDFVRKILGV
ncbi:MAG: ATP-binding cassette domain-containing protein [Aurantimicrobium sp.]|nr:ATP-binding cassette domain-containing protein [Aurantimicrobium sp.]